MSDTPVSKIQAVSDDVADDVAGDERWGDGIAIIGMSARFPQSKNVQEYWEHLLAGDLLISDLSEEELLEVGVRDQELSNSAYVRRGSVISDAESIDTTLFGYSRREAEIIDPQQRVLLECAWEALEDAGCISERKRIGVFAGVGISSYLLQLLSNQAIVNSVGKYQLMIANDKDYCATRVAYKLDLRGPAVTVQSACSTSLAGVHLACLSLLSNECDVALAGGASIAFPQGTGYMYMPGMILSPDGFCRPFDADARGTVPGRGAGIVVLKRLTKALLNGDNIIAVIRGSAWNNDGSGKVGYTAPSVDGQVEVLRSALRVAGVSADRIGYIETHGTATELGDSIEIAALTTVFGDADAPTGACLLGAVKSNMGHADVAAGVAGLIKAALAIRSGTVPPTPSFARAKSSLQLDRSPFFMSASPVPWPKSGERWAGVSSFGIGGTNVHTILSEPPSCPVLDLEPVVHIFPLSAQTPSALAAARERLADHVSLHGSLPLSDVASTLQRGRREFLHRRVFVARTASELSAVLREPEKLPNRPASSLKHEVVFLFPGQGQQFFGMAAGLYESDATLRQHIEDGAKMLLNEFHVDCVDVIRGRSTVSEAHLNDTEFAQPLLFLIEYALAIRWQSLGVEPTALLGHSLGELTAATIAGVFSYHDGLRLAAERGRLMAQTPAGIMLAVMLPPDRLSEYLGHDIWIAAENGPKMTAVSGSADAVIALEARLQKEHVACVRLASKNAFHTPLMMEAAKSFRKSVESVSRHEPRIPWLSNVTGSWIDPAEAQNPQYWANQIVSRVRFKQNLSELREHPRLLLEVGPGEALTGIARQQLQKCLMIASLGDEKRQGSRDVAFLEAVGKVWQSGASISWQALYPDVKPRTVSLPTYPFERNRCYINPASPSTTEVPFPSDKAADKPAKREDIATWFYASSWQSTPPVVVLPQHAGKSIVTWLVLLDCEGVGRTVVEKLRSDHRKVITITVSNTFEQEGIAFSIDPSNQNHYQMLYRSIGKLDLRPEGLLNFWTIRGTPAEAYDSMILLLQASRIDRHRFRQVEIVTDRLESVSGEPIDGPERAQVLGLLRMLPAEYPGMTCRSIDIESATDDVEMVAEQIVQEVHSLGESQSIAVRNRRRWRHSLIASPISASSKSPFRDSGVYLITGGAGGIGYSIAQFLLSNHKANVVITGRSSLPPREKWGKWLAEEGSDNAFSRRIIRIKALETAGGKVLYLDADVVKAEDMTRVISRTESCFGTINGVIHAAGVAGGGTVAAQTIDDSLYIREAKVKGSIVLAKALQGRQLDFLLFCSSISAWIPAVAQGAYAAANAFEDYFASYCRITLKLPAIAIGFDAWRDVGMAFDMVLPAGFESVKDERLRTAMTTSEGLEVVRRVLSHWREPHILTSTVDLTSLYRPPADTSSQQGPEEAIASNENSTLTAMIEIWKDLLATEFIEPNDNFFELGGHSLMGTMLIARIRDQFGITLTLRILFEAPTPLLLIKALQQSNSFTEPTAEDDREEFAL